MGRQKEELSIFEQMGGTYTEKDGILYPNIRIGEEETEAMQNTFSGKYGDLWKKYLKENQPERYYHLVCLGQLKQKAQKSMKKQMNCWKGLCSSIYRSINRRIQILQWKCGGFGNRLRQWQRKWFFKILSTVITKY